MPESEKTDLMNGVPDSISSARMQVITTKLRQHYRRLDKLQKSLAEVKARDAYG